MGYDASNGDGVVYQASQVTPGSITDGLSNTFFAGEKWLDPPVYYTSAEAGDDNSMLEGFDHDIVRWCSKTDYPPVRDMTNDGLHDERHKLLVSPTTTRSAARIPPGSTSSIATAACGSITYQINLDNLPEPGLPQRRPDFNENY